MLYISTLNRSVLFLSILTVSTRCTETGEKLKGHLKPIFSYGDRLSVEVFRGFPEPSSFFRDFVSREKPVLFQGAAKSFPAFKKWSDEYFLSLPESEKLLVTVETKKKENRLQPTDELSLSSFIQHYHNKEIYLVESIPSFLRKDVLIPSCISCKSIIQDNMIQAMMWVSSGGTQSVLHNDYAENINCVFRGTKTFFIADRKYMDILNVTELGYSEVDVDRVDLYKYPGLYDIEHYKVTVEAGDCLYIPFLWVHQVTSQHQNMAVNFWWKDHVTVNYDTCDMSGQTTVDNINFVGFDSLSDAQYKMIRGRLRHRVRTKGPMAFKDLLEVILDVMGLLDIQEDYEDVDEKLKEIVKKIFMLVDAFPTDGVITLDDVDNLSTEDLKTIRQYLTSIVGPDQSTRHEVPGGEGWGENGSISKGHGDKHPDLAGQNGADKMQTNEEKEWDKMVENRRKKLEL